MTQEYSVTCSNCANNFKAPFIPQPGRVIYCPACEIKKTNMSKMIPNIYLAEYISASIGEDKGKISILKDKQEYVFILQQGKEAQLLCTLKWSPKFNDILQRRRSKDLLPPFSDMTGTIKIHEPKLIKTITEFIKQTKLEGITYQIE